jgi:hypothetical protein
LGQVLAGEGRGAETRGIIEELKTIRTERYVSPYYLGMLYTALGEFDKAFYWLEKVIDGREYWAHWFAGEYRFDPLRKDARFVKLLKRFESAKNKAARQITSDSSNAPTILLTQSNFRLAVLFLALAILLALIAASAWFIMQPEISRPSKNPLIRSIQ